MPDTQALDAIIHFGAMAADHELLNKPVPVSSVRNPDGTAQHETAAERTRRIIATAVTHLVDAGLLTVPDDIGERLEQPIPLIM